MNCMGFTGHMVWLRLCNYSFQIITGRLYLETPITLIAANTFLRLVDALCHGLQPRTNTRVVSWCPQDCF